MKRTTLFVRGVSAAALMAGTLVVEGTQPATVAQWDFNQGDLRATAGAAMEYRGDTEDHTAFVTAEINGSQARVMRFPEADASQGFIVTHGAQPNGGGTKVNQYTLIFDLMYPAASGGWRALFQTAENNENDAELFVHPSHAIGIGNYHGTLTPDQWHRVAIVVDQSQNTLDKYIDGQLVGTEIIAGGTDGEWALNPTFLLFTDDTGTSETGLGFVNSIQFRAEALDAEAVAELGGPSSGNIPPFEEEEPVELQIVRSGSNVIITALNSENVKLQMKDDLGDESWSDVPGLPTGTNSFTLPANQDAAFYRAEKLD